MVKASLQCIAAAACLLFALTVGVTDLFAQDLDFGFGYTPGPIRFHPCPEDARAECGTLTLPVDYRKPFGEKFDLALIRVKATKPHKRIGVAFQAPGGPGLSGIDNILRGLQLLPLAAVRALERFDVVSFDERGSGRSRPVFCDLGGPVVLPGPSDDPLGPAPALDDFSHRVATTCLQQNGPFIYTMSTNTIARDMDMVRRALGERTMTILGASAGTGLGAAYAGMFPERVRAMVLDAGYMPEFGDSFVEYNAEQNSAFELTLKRLDQLCHADIACPARDPGVVAAFDTLKARLDAQPIPTPDGAMLTGNDVRNVIGDLLYIEPAWPAIAGALADGLNGDYGLFFARRLRARNIIRVALDTPVLDAYDVILCNDFDTRRPASEILPVDAVIDQQNPRFWGRLTFAGEIARCAQWPAADRPQIRDLSKRLDVPVLLVGNDFDPATPLNWTRRLARIIGNERHLVRYQGGGHGAYLTTGNTCIDTIVESYLFDLRLPKEGTVCPQQPLSFAR